MIDGVGDDEAPRTRREIALDQAVDDWAGMIVSREGRPHGVIVIIADGTCVHASVMLNSEGPTRATELMLSLAITEMAVMMAKGDYTDRTVKKTI